MRNKTKMVNWLMKNKHIYNLLRYTSFKKIIFFQNPCHYRYCHFMIENVNPNHVYYIYVVNSKKNKGIMKIAKIIR